MPDTDLFLQLAQQTPRPASRKRVSPSTPGKVGKHRTPISAPALTQGSEVQPTADEQGTRTPKQPDKAALSGRTDEPDAVAVRTIARASDRLTEPHGRPAVRPYGLSLPIPPQPAHRRPERYAFQFWADQITRLKKLRQVLNLAQDPEERDEITLSDLVRTAIDEYLARQIDPLGDPVRPDG
jgi:hypothetical protein